MTLFIVAGLVVIVAIAGALFLMPAPVPEVVKEPTPIVTESTSTMPVSDSTNTAIQTAYKNGSYTQTGTYKSPAGNEEVEISLMIENDIVKGASFKGMATNPGSVNNQGKFAKGFEAEVVGKSIDSIALGVVNGSSLTPKGFMDALGKIKAEAKVN